MIRAGPVAIPILVAVMATTCFPAGKKPQQVFSIRDQSADTWTIDYTPGSPKISTLKIGGQYHILFAGDANPDAGGEGAPNLPVDVVSLGIPFDASVTAELLNPSFVTMEGQLVAPRPTLMTNGEAKTEAAYTKSPVIYSQNRFLPSRLVSVASVYTLRGQRICALRLAPYQYNPVTKALRRIFSATLKIHRVQNFSRGVAPGLATRRDPHFEQVFRGLLLNYEQAKQWRQAMPRLSRPQSDPTRDWFRTGKMYYRIPVAADGWYRISANELAAAGISFSQVDQPTVKIYQRGVQTPSWIRPDSSIEFYARRNYGDASYYDLYTDTSVCWMTWGDTLGLRFTQSIQSALPQGPTVQSAFVTRHFEQNTDFYVGTGLYELGQNSPVPGRGWVWDYYYPGTSTAHPFQIDAIDTASYPAAAVRIRLYSTTGTYTADGRDHKAKFWINDSLVGQVYFKGRTGVTFTATIPSSWLVNGVNQMTVKSDTSSVNPNQFYLDWFEIDYGRLLRAQNGQLLFTVHATGGSASALYTVTGFANPLIDVFDLTARRKVIGGTVSGDSSSGFSVEFRDTGATQKDYMVLCASGQMEVLPLSPKTFSDIRNNAQGADYIVITHRMLLPPAQQLADHRHSFNAVRTAVIDVQDIYDEFNYGVMNAERLKDFLRYAYTNWPPPAPAYVLMFGSASWDTHGYLPTSVKPNLVPAYGVPAGDNWFVCFNTDTVFLPSMLIGRLPVENPLQAQQVAAKVVGYDTYTLGDWNKDYLFITGGFDSTEQMSFNNISDNSINSYIQPSPIGGTIFRAYKTGPSVIDPGYKDYMKGLVQQGLVYMNYLGHSGGRLWSVDIGPPDELQNTGGQLPFVSSVSCNVGAFAEPSFTALAEDFVLADNRGAIAMWSSSALGYPYQGSSLVNNFLRGVLADSLRDFGTLTTLARIQLWQNDQSFISVSDMNLTPLLGDPLSQLAIPTKPDLAVSSADIALNGSAPTAFDTALTLNIHLHNYGLVPSDSVVVSVMDLVSGHSTTLYGNRRIAPPFHLDSLLIPWKVLDQPGKHTITVSIDPNGLVTEVTRANNVASAEIYIFANSLTVIKPLNDMVVPPGSQTLVVSTPAGGDSLSFSYAFELDTVSTFDSPFVRTSTVEPGLVSGMWITSPLAANRVYFWRARTMSGTEIGRWVTSSFSTSQTLPVPPVARWREYDPKQFARDVAVQTATTDTGVTISRNPPVSLFVRSLGYRADLNKDYYSIIRINQQTAFGLWWIIGNSFMTVRINQFTGAYDFRPFNVQGLPAMADSMAAFINATAPGDYFAISVIYDGRTNVNANLNQAIKSLGSAFIDSLQPGQSWEIIGRKGTAGPGMPPLEHWSPNGVAEDSIVIQNLYSFGSGSVTTQAIPLANSWHSFHWQQSGVQGVTSVRVALLGVRADGSVDTLRILPQDSSDVNLTFLNTAFSNPAYTGFGAAALLSSTDALVTPSLREWSMELEPPADLAISSKTVGIAGLTAERRTTVNIPVTVFNIGYRTVDSARLAVNLYDVAGVPHPLTSAMLDSIPVNRSLSVTVPVQTTNLPKTVRLQMVVAPSGSSRDLASGNNTVNYSFTVKGNEAVGVQVFADGEQLMDGDYVATNPKILVHLTDTPPPGVRTVEFYVDGTQVTLPKPGISSPGSGQGEVIPVKVARGQTVLGDPTFSPALSAGQHTFRIMVIQQNAAGGVDSLEHDLSVNVSSEMRILQVFNYPNPFPNDTYFTFILTGSRAPDELTIRVFTVAGRKIKQISLPPGTARIGVNRVYWDGRDNDGDEIANGYYLYQVVTTAEGKTETAIQKLAKIR